MFVTSHCYLNCIRIPPDNGADDCPFEHLLRQRRAEERLVAISLTADNWMPSVCLVPLVPTTSWRLCGRNCGCKKKKKNKMMPNMPKQTQTETINDFMAIDALKYMCNYSRFWWNSIHAFLRARKLMASIKKLPQFRVTAGTRRARVQRSSSLPYPQTQTQRVQYNYSALCCWRTKMIVLHVETLSTKRRRTQNRTPQTFDCLRRNKRSCTTATCRWR